DDFARNLALAERVIPAAAEAGADLLAYPEVFLFIGPAARKLEIAESLDGPTVARFREAAARQGMMILLGSIHERAVGERSRVYNTAVLIGRDGGVLAVYRKLKLFDVELPGLSIRESATIIPGDSPPPVVATDIGRVGITICFDLRFPELYRDLRRRGAEIVFVPSNFTAPTGAAHWSVLLRARAIENQCYVAAPAQAGQHSARYRSHGHTLAVDPWGGVLCEAGDEPGLFFADVDLTYLEKVRAELPVGVPGEA
ncbi:MAG: carbon-nitrogen hydrolase family protein, partial [Gammaproteobacteria bacterium]|nr:carbon-nitrogen hydrolase family protein [Gammaproteobacteria bacterium]